MGALCTAQAEDVIGVASDVAIQEERSRTAALQRAADTRARTIHPANSAKRRAMLKSIDEALSDPETEEAARSKLTAMRQSLFPQPRGAATAAAAHSPEQQAVDLQQLELQNEQQQVRVKHLEKRLNETAACDVPDYWHADATLGGYAMVDVTAQLVGQAQQLLDGTMTDRLGRGNDQRSYSYAPYTSLCCIQVERIENRCTWAQYAAERAKLAGNQKVLVRRGIETNTLVVSTSDFWAGETTLDSGINEVFLLHGTKHEHVALMAHHGFEERLAGSSAGTFYGMGTYFGENACKADQYSTPNADGDYQMFVSRVALGGHPFICNDNRQTVSGHQRGEPVNRWRLLPEISQDCGSSTGLRYSALIGSVTSRHEFVVYRGAQAYPEYVLTYKRV